MSRGSGIRPHIWALVGICLVGVGVLVAFGGDDAPVASNPNRIAAAAGRPASVTEPGGSSGASPSTPRAGGAPSPGSNRSSVKGSSPRAGGGASGENDRSSGLGAGTLRERSARAGGGAGRPRSTRVRQVVDTADGAATRSPGTSSKGTRLPTGGARPTVDSGLELEVAELGERVGLVDPLGGDTTEGDPARTGSGDEVDPIRAAADAVATEFLMRQELQDRFGGKILPWAYPIEALRAEIAEDVTALSAADRQVLLEYLAENVVDAPAPLVMSDRYSGNVYYGPDAEPNPSNVKVVEAVSLYKRD